jgi:hypothetical protein
MLLAWEVTSPVSCPVELVLGGALCKLVLSWYTMSKTVVERLDVDVEAPVELAVRERPSIGALANRVDADPELGGSLAGAEPAALLAAPVELLGDDLAHEWLKDEPKIVLKLVQCFFFVAIAKNRAAVR